MIKKKEFKVDYWEDVWKSVSIPQEIRANDIHEIHHVLTKFLPVGKFKLVEIGCAPGSWLTYFYNYYHYSVNGVEYAPLAFQKTIENLRIQNIPGEIHQCNFLEFQHDPYDVVFSAGFIEHFENVKTVIQKKVDLCKPNGGFVITSIPCMNGINWWVSRTFRPHVAEGHFPISKSKLIAYHEECGLTTLYCNYFGAFHIIPPMALNRYSKEHPNISFLMNLPFRIWNKSVSMITQRLKYYPQVSFLSSGIIYIGKK